jgi:hypothetical protein
MLIGDETEHCIIMTNMRLFKLEYYKMDEILIIDDLIKVDHQVNGKLRWDKIVAGCRDGKVRTVGICTTEVTAFFVAQLHDAMRRRDAALAAAPTPTSTPTPIPTIPSSSPSSSSSNSSNGITSSSSHPSGLTIQTMSSSSSLAYPSLHHQSYGQQYGDDSRMIISPIL